MKSQEEIMKRIQDTKEHNAKLVPVIADLEQKEGKANDTFRRHYKRTYNLNLKLIQELEWVLS